MNSSTFICWCAHHQKARIPLERGWDIPTYVAMSPLGTPDWDTIQGPMEAKQRAPQVQILYPFVRFRSREKLQLCVAVSATSSRVYTRPVPQKTSEGNYWQLGVAAKHEVSISSTDFHVQGSKSAMWASQCIQKLLFIKSIGWPWMTQLGDQVGQWWIQWLHDFVQKWHTPLAA